MDIVFSEFIGVVNVWEVLDVGLGCVVDVLSRFIGVVNVWG